MTPNHSGRALRLYHIMLAAAHATAPGAKTLIPDLDTETDLLAALVVIEQAAADEGKLLESILLTAAAVERSGLATLY